MKSNNLILAIALISILFLAGCVNQNSETTGKATGTTAINPTIIIDSILPTQSKSTITDKVSEPTTLETGKQSFSIPNNPPEGFVYNLDLTTANNALTHNCTITKAAEFDEINQTWIIYYKNPTLTTQKKLKGLNLQAGKGYFIKVTSKCTLQLTKYNDYKLYKTFTANKWTFIGIGSKDNNPINTTTFNQNNCGTTKIYEYNPTKAQFTPTTTDLTKTKAYAIKTTNKCTIGKPIEPPYITTIPNQTINSGETFKTINLNDYISDADNTKEEIRWAVSGQRNLTVTIDNTTKTATINYPTNWTETADITFTATDSYGLKASTIATFTVNLLIQKTCAESGGNTCDPTQDGDQCDGQWLTATDTQYCCSGDCYASSCPTTKPQTNTTSQQNTNNTILITRTTKNNNSITNFTTKPETISVKNGEPVFVNSINGKIETLSEKVKNAVKIDASTNDTYIIELNTKPLIEQLKNNTTRTSINTLKTAILNEQAQLLTQIIGTSRSTIKRKNLSGLLTDSH